MGHRNISMTNDTYGHLFDEGAKDTSDKARGFVPRRRQA
jgi:integrase